MGSGGWPLDTVVMVDMSIMIGLSGVVGYFAATAIAALKWKHGILWRIAPSIWGGVFGMVAGPFLKLYTEGTYGISEIVLTYSLLGFFFTIAAWMGVLEGGSRD